jgi:hypothetical protein
MAATPPAVPASKPCDRCVRGTWVDSNGAAWRCHACNGMGRVRVAAVSS